MDNIIIFIYLELITAPMAILKWYWKHCNDKFIKLSEEGIGMRLNKWEKIICTVKYKLIENGNMPNLWYEEG